ncbi:hypothetical protein OQA88_10653 [Cercophora sp. LCS_1]
MDALTTLYSPLDPARSPIRLLEIISADSDAGPVRCLLRIVSLDDKPTYCALSYVWGDPAKTAKILIAAESAAGILSEEKAIDVTTNLEAALRHVRSQWAAHRRVGHDTSSFRLWADAICINQTDTKERGQQVQIMRSIYKSADLVLAWLGDQDFTLAFDGIKAMASEMDKSMANPEEGDFGKLEWMKRHPTLCDRNPSGSSDPYLLHPTWKSIQGLFSSPYWSRVWIFQEIVLANELLFVTTGSSIEWRKLELVGYHMERLQSQLHRTASTRPGWVSEASWVCLTTKSVAWNCTFLAGWVRSSAWFKHLDDQQPPAAEDAVAWRWARWQSMLASSVRFKATDPRDYVYGLLGVSGVDIVPDYSGAKSLGDVYCEYLERWLRDHRQRPTGSVTSSNYPLLFLAYTGTGCYQVARGIPTWVPNFALPRGIGTATVVSCLGKAADRGVFGAGNDAYPTIQGSSLLVQGLRIESVLRTSEASILKNPSDGRLLKYMASFVTRHPTYVSGIPSFQAFLRLIHQDPLSGVDKDAILKALGFVVYLFLKCQGPHSFADTMALLGVRRQDGIKALDNWFDRNFFPGTSLESFGIHGGTLSVLQRGTAGVSSAAWSKLAMAFLSHAECRFFETESGYLSLAPNAIEPGDILYVLKDCNVPVILRRVPTTNGRSYFSHVSTVFVVGLMDGEAVKFLESGKSAPETLELR